ncbi:hypothetical protein CTAYLR_009726 [Chrysophaeum taylorii]|uniref:Flavin-containing monooxygenase n=1 Tax=Chrysophaeum taylorii TaxID=2483200 RepID=A0AAD7XGZ6_9STRA|nr:hypothetical protein CTAYLR_009726 [Chrysophaeum taylorii]
MVVCVIGAGSSGLIAARELKEAGVEFVVYEIQEGPGGLYLRDNYENSCHTSNYCYTSFACYPPPDLTQCDHFTLGGYVKYLEEFVDAFGLREFIEYGAEVSKVSRLDDGKWDVRLKDGSSKVFDAVVCASGTHTNHDDPKAHPWLDGFGGDVFHSSEFRRASDFEGKRVVICGGGESASDVSVQCAKVAAQTWIAMRPRTGHITPRGAHLPELDHDVEPRLEAHRNDPDRVPPEASLDLDLSVALYSTCPALFPVHNYKDVAAMATRDYYHGTKLNVYTKSFVTTQFGTKNCGMASAIGRYGCIPKPPVASCDGKTVRFEDGTSADAVDAIILCIGYKNDICFLEDAELKEKLINPRNCLKHVAHPDVPGFYLVGFVRPAFGNIPTLAEMQAGWVAQLITGKMPLPPRVEMMEKIEKDREFEETTFTSGKRLKALTNYYAFAMDMGDITGHPQYLKILLTDPILALKMLVGQFSGFFFKLDQDYPKYRKCIMDMPLAEAWHFDLAIFLTSFHLSFLPIKWFQIPRLQLAPATKLALGCVLFLNPFYLLFVVFPCAFVTLVLFVYLNTNSVRLASNFDGLRGLDRPSYFVAKTAYDDFHKKWARVQIIIMLALTIPFDIYVTALLKKHLVNKSHMSFLKFMEVEYNYKKVKATFVFYS